MRRLQAFKYELMPDSEQMRDMRCFADACRFVYNKALAMQKDNHVAGSKFIGYVAMAKCLTGWRQGSDTPWLKNAPCHPLQHALKDLERACKNFSAKRADFPRFKRKGSGGAFRYPDPKQIKLDQRNSRIFLPKLGWVRYRNSRDVAQRAQDAPDLGLAKANTMHAFDDSPHAFKRPQFCAKSLGSQTLQEGGANGRQLLFIKLGWAPSLRNLPQSVNAAFIE